MRGATGRGGEGSAAKKTAEEGGEDEVRKWQKGALQEREAKGRRGHCRQGQGRRGQGSRAEQGRAWHGRARAGLVTADGIVSFCDHSHASGIVGSSVGGTHKAFSLPGSLFAIEPVGANVTVLVGVAAQ